MDKDVTVVACVGANRSLTLDLQKRVTADDGGSKHATLAHLSLESANQKLSLTAHGCLESLRDIEVLLLAKESLSLCLCHSGSSELCFSGRNSVCGLPHPDQVARKNQNSAASHLRVQTAGKLTAR